MKAKTTSYNQFLGKWLRLRPHAQFNIPEILQWVDAYYKRHGRWPQAKSGKVRGSLAEFWTRVDAALRLGQRGLEGGSSLAKLLWKERGVRNLYSKPRLSVDQILAWADADHERTGKWPSVNAGKVHGADGESWMNLNQALQIGLRGLQGGTSLAQLLTKHRGVPNPSDLPRFRVAEVLAWADAFHERTGKWPTDRSGAIQESSGATWRKVDGALLRGRRGFPGGSSLARLLEEQRGRRNQMARPKLTVVQILHWADMHHGRTGNWPSQVGSDPIPEAPDEKWLNINRDLRLGLRGLPRTTLRHLLADHRGLRHHFAPPPLTVEMILGWADTYRDKTGRWPAVRDRDVRPAPGETWKGIDAALHAGQRSLPGGDTLARLLARHRAAPLKWYNRTPLTLKEILAWADAHRRRTRKWPKMNSGPVHGAPHENWLAINTALSMGARGLPRRQSLAKLLAEHRGARHHRFPPPLDFVKILTWADAFHQRTGRWPTHKDGAIKDEQGETWSTVNTALMLRQRGLRSGMSLAKFLYRHRNAPYRPAARLRTFTVTEILKWVDMHRQRTGDWPKLAQYGDPIPEAPGINWRTVDHALRNGTRGLPGGTTLQLFLSQHRGLRHPLSPPRLSVEQILRWADEHHEKTGRWPKSFSQEPVLSAPEETWSALNIALGQGHRGLPGGDSLARLLARHRGARNHLALPPFTLVQILSWADAHRERTGKWPTATSGLVTDAVGEKWHSICAALRLGLRGLPGEQSLARVLVEHRGKRDRHSPPRLTVQRILAWANSHHQRTLRWPRRHDGPIADAPGETWNAVHLALRRGSRGLRGGSSLLKLMARFRRDHVN